MVIPENGGNRKLDIMAVNGSKWQILTEIGHSSYSEFFDWKHNYNFMSPQACLEKFKCLREGCK